MRNRMIAICVCLYTSVLGSRTNGSGQYGIGRSGMDKMVHEENGIVQNGTEKDTDKMLWIKRYR